MTTLKIPELHLFNSRKEKCNHISDRIEHTSQGLVRNYNNYNPNRTYKYLDKTTNIIPTPDYQYQSINLNRTINIPSYLPSVGTRYKQIADNYLQRTTGPLPVYLQPYSYIPLNTTNNSYSFKSSPQKRSQVNNNRCQCQMQNHKNNIHNQKIIQNNPYLKNQNIQIKLKKQQKLLKDPYLVPTSRQNQRFIPKILKQNVQIIKNKSFIEKLDKSKIIQKIKTHQSEEEKNQIKFSNKQQVVINIVNQNTNRTQYQSTNRNQSIDVNKKNSTKEQYIQTELNQSLIRQNQAKKAKKRTQRQLQRFLEQQQQAIQYICMNFDQQNQTMINLKHLQEDKEDIVQKSKQILLRLNQITDQKKQYSFFSKNSSGNKKMHNPFGLLQLE